MKRIIIAATIAAFSLTLATTAESRPKRIQLYLGAGGSSYTAEIPDSYRHFPPSDPSAAEIRKHKKNGTLNQWVDQRVRQGRYQERIVREWVNPSPVQGKRQVRYRY